MSSGFDIVAAKNRKLREALTDAQRTVAELRGRLHERQQIARELNELRKEMRSTGHPPEDVAHA